MLAGFMRGAQGRRFLVDVGVVVLGVLIALGAEQAVQSVKSQQDLASTKKSLREEIYVATHQGWEREAINLCLRERIKVLAEKVGRSPASWVADPLPARSDFVGPVLPQVYRTPSRIWSRDAWDAALASGITNHMSRQQVASYAAAYAQISHLSQLEVRENEYTSNIAFLSWNQSLEPRTRVEALTSLAELDRINNMMVLISGQLETSARELGVQLDTAEVKKTFRETLEAQRKFRGNCVQDPRANS